METRSWIEPRFQRTLSILLTIALTVFFFGSTASAAAPVSVKATPNPGTTQAGVAILITLTALKADGVTTETTYGGNKSVVVSGYSAAPDGTIGSGQPTGGNVKTLSGTSTNIGNVNFSNGVGTFSLILNKAGAAQSLSFNVANNFIARMSLTVTSAGTQPASVSSSAATLTPVAGQNDNVTLTALDTYKNVFTGYAGDKTVTVSGYSTAPDGSVGTFNGTALSGASTAVTVAFTNGVGNSPLNLALHNAAAQTIAFSLSGVTAPSTSLTFTPTAAAASRVVATATSVTPAAGSGVTVTLTAKDAYFNPISNFAGTYTVTISGYAAAPGGLVGSATPSGGSATALSGTSTNVNVTFTSSVATLTLVLDDAASQTVSFAVSGLPTAGTLTFVPTPLTATALSVVPATTTPVAGASTGVVLNAVDTYGNVATSYAGAKTVTIGGYQTAPDGLSTGSFGGVALSGSTTNASLTFASGTVTTSLVLYKAAAQTLTFAISGLAGTSASVTPTPKSAYQATASAATLTPGVNVADNITLTVLDEYKNVDTAYAGSQNVTISGYGADPNGGYGNFNYVNLTASPNTIAVTFASGVAVAPLRLYDATAHSIAFSLAGVTNPGTNTLVITPSAGTGDSVATTGTATLVTASPVAGTAFSITLKVRDQYGNLFTPYNGTYAITIGGYATAPDGTHVGSFNGTTLAGSTTTVNVAFSSGVASSVSLLLYSAAAQNLTFTFGGISVPVAYLSVDPAAAPAAAATASAALSRVSIYQADAITLSIVDAYGNLCETYTGSYNVQISGYQTDGDSDYDFGRFNGTELAGSTHGTTPGRANLTTVAVSFSGGQATAPLLFYYGGSSPQLVTFDVLYSSPSYFTTATLSIDASADVASSASLAGSDTDAVVGTAQSLTVTLHDGSGAVLAGFTGELTVTFSGYAASPNGTQATLAYTYLSAAPSTTGTRTLTLSGSSTSFEAHFTNGITVLSSTGYTTAPLSLSCVVATTTSGTTNTVTVARMPGPADSAAATGYSTTPAAGASNPVTITAYDAYGNVATGYAGTTTVVVSGYLAPKAGAVGPSFNGTSLTGSSTVVSIDFTDGVAAAVPLVLVNAASQSVVLYNDELQTHPSLTLNAIAPTATAATALAASVPLLGPLTGASQTVTLTATDAYGNVAAGFSGAKSVAVSGYDAAPAGSLFAGTLLAGSSTSVATTFTQGVGTGTLVLIPTTAQSLVFTAAGLTTAALALQPTPIHVTVATKVDGVASSVGGTVSGSLTYTFGAPTSLSVATNPGYRFLGWSEAATGKVVGTAATLDTYRLTISTDFVASFATLATTYTLTFYDASSRIYKQSIVAENGSFSFSSVPVLTQPGYVFAGWTDGTTTYATDATIAHVVGDLTLRPVLVRSATLWRLAVHGGTASGAQTTAVTPSPTPPVGTNAYDVATASTATLVAGAAPQGQSFVGWHDDSDTSNPTSVFSMKATYSFVVTRDVSVTALYATNPVFLPTITLDGTVTTVAVDATYGRLYFLSTYSAAAGYSLVETGILITTSDPSSNPLTLSNYMYRLVSTAQNAAGQFYSIIRTKYYALSPVTFYVRSYLIYRDDATGEYSTVYSTRTVTAQMVLG